ncbi:DUF885 family protein [Bacteroidota bacterium]
MKNGSSILLVVVTIGLIISGIWLSQLIWFKPFNIHHFYERAYIEFLWEDPEALTQTGILKHFGISSYEAKLTSVSPSNTERLAEIGRKNLDVLKKYNRDKLNDEDLLSYDVLYWFLETGVEGEPFLFHDYPVTHISGPHIEIPQFLSGAHRIENKKDAENYLKRLQQVDEKLGSLIDGLEKRRQLGIIAPTFILQRAISFCDHFVQIPLEENVLYTSFQKKLAKLESGDTAQHAVQLEECKTIVGTDIYGAYKRLSRYLMQLERGSMSIAGVWQLPNGDAYYKYCLTQHNGINNDPEELYETGKLEMNRLKGELSILLNMTGKTTNDDVSKTLLALTTDSALTFQTDSAGRKACLSYFSNCSNEIKTLLPAYFNKIPSTNLIAVEVPEYLSSSSNFAFYVPPRGEPLSDGKMYVNTWKADYLTHFLATSYAYHEGVPGHHLQKGIQAELSDLPTFRRFLPFTAYTEGWAMYAEQLGHEMTETQNPWDKIGLLQSDLFRTVRMLTDIGIHHKKWLREQAIDFMLENTGLTVDEVEAEVDRYIVWPGQGCAYKVGQLKFLELRTLAQTELGDHFDIKELHEVLIGQGAMPLEILENRVKHYISEKKKAL